ncbi:MAG: hypothetical protein AAF725_03800 [Acidobacteriota bacterium]
MNKLVLSFIPALLAFGPFFIALAAQDASPSSWLSPVAGYAGAAGLGLGLVYLFTRQQRLEKEIVRLQQQK